jgi:hypothetical protein
LKVPSKTSVPAPSLPKPIVDAPPPGSVAYVWVVPTATLNVSRVTEPESVKPD